MTSNYSYTYPEWYGDDSKELHQSRYMPMKREEARKALEKGNLQNEKEARLTIHALCKKIRRETEVAIRRADRYSTALCAYIGEGHNYCEEGVLVVQTSWRIKGLGECEPTSRAYTITTRVPLKDFWPWALGQSKDPLDTRVIERQTLTNQENTE